MDQVLCVTDTISEQGEGNLVSDTQKNPSAANEVDDSMCETSDSKRCV